MGESGAPATIDPALLAGPAAPVLPLAFVALDACTGPLAPPYPVIGIGDPRHPAAAWVDAVIEAPVTAEALARNLSGHVQAASLCVQLLRSIDGMEPEPALLLESLAYGVLQASADHAGWLERRPRSSPVAAGRVAMSRDGDVLRVTIDRPEARNAVDRAARDGLYEAFEVSALDPGIERVELRSVGPAFCVGGDLDEFGTTRDPATAHAIRGRTLPALMMVKRPEIFDVYVQGACIGSGLEMAAFAGRVTAAPEAWFQLPELAMGLIPGAGGCVSVSRRIGRQRAALMILSGKRIDATTALRWGLVDAIEERPPVDPRLLHAD